MGLDKAGSQRMHVDGEEMATDGIIVERMRQLISWQCFSRILPIICFSSGRNSVYG